MDVYYLVSSKADACHRATAMGEDGSIENLKKIVSVMHNFELDGVCQAERQNVKMK